MCQKEGTGEPVVSTQQTCIQPLQIRSAENILCVPSIKLILENMNTPGAPSGPVKASMALLEASAEAWSLKQKSKILTLFP